SDILITAVAPAQAAAIVDITVTTPNGTSSTGSADHFTYNAAAAPAITSVSPNTGTTAGGTVVTISGSGFTSASNVQFGNIAALAFAVNSDTSIIATAPPQAAATVDIKVTTPSGVSSTGAADHFTYSAASA